MATLTQGAHSSATTQNSAQDIAALLGRILMAWIFVPAGFGKIAGFAGAVGYATSVGLPLPQVGVALGLLIELFGGLALLLGWRVRWAALALAVFSIVAAFFFHNYWSLPEAQQMMQKINFDKNLAIAGGLLAFAAFGAGRLSLDARTGRA